MLALLPLSATKATDAPAWTPARFQSVDATLQDLELTLRARKAILQDDKLAALNLGVTVRGRVAILWGTVATKELSARAEDFLRPVVGLQGIRNELRIDGNGQPPVAGGPRQPTPLAEPVPNPPLASGVRPPPPQWAASGQQQVWRPVLDGTANVRVPGAADMPGYSGATAGDARPALVPESPKPDSAMPSARPRDPAQPTGRANRPLALAPPVPPPEQDHRTNSLARIVESIRLRDRRFQPVQAQVLGSIVTLRGTADCRDCLFELAQIVSRVAGVERVVVEEVPDRPNP